LPERSRIDDEVRGHDQRARYAAGNLCAIHDRNSSNVGCRQARQSAPHRLVMDGMCGQFDVADAGVPQAEDLAGQERKACDLNIAQQPRVVVEEDGLDLEAAPWTLSTEVH
jgi:hypothetical protein